MISMFGVRRSALRSCGIFIEIRCGAGWWRRLISGLGAVFGITLMESWALYGLIFRIGLWKLGRLHGLGLGGRGSWNPHSFANCANEWATRVFFLLLYVQSACASISTPKPGGGLATRLSTG